MCVWFTLLLGLMNDQVGDVLWVPRMAWRFYFLYFPLGMWCLNGYRAVGVWCFLGSFAIFFVKLNCSVGGWVSQSSFQWNFSAVKKKKIHAYNLNVKFHSNDEGIVSIFYTAIVYKFTLHFHNNTTNK